MSETVLFCPCEDTGLYPNRTLIRNVFVPICMRHICFFKCHLDWQSLSFILKRVQYENNKANIRLDWRSLGQLFAKVFSGTAQPFVWCNYMSRNNNGGKNRSIGACVLEITHWLCIAYALHWFYTSNCDFNCFFLLTFCAQVVYFRV